MSLLNSRNARKAEAAAAAGTRTVGSTIMFILKILGTILLIGVTTGLMFVCIFAFYVKTTLQSQLDITFEDYALQETSYLYYQDDSGNMVQWQEIYSDSKRTWADLDEIPEYMVQAAVAIEDKRYYEHDGVDWYRTAGAFYTMFFGQGDDSYGASTITQQLIKNLTGEDDVTVKRKIMEIFRALEVEKYYDKDEIMTWYLNVIYLGQNAYGVQAAAETYFGKDVGDLTLAECASIIGITNSPSAYNPYFNYGGINGEENNKTRQVEILYQMYEQGYITYDEYTEAVAQPLEFVNRNVDEVVDYVYSYYQETVINDAIDAIVAEKDLSRKAAETMVYNGGLKIYTCIDKSIQEKVDSIYEDLNEIPSVTGSSAQFQSAMTIQDPETGYIVAIAGGVGEKTINFAYNRATDAQRLAGSSLKPLAVYGPALDTNVISLGSTYEDSPSQKVNGLDWPKNDSNTYSNKMVNIKTAVQQSLNTIAVRITDQMGPQVSYNYLVNKLGFTTLVDGDIYLAPMALGQLTNGATVREMTSAYCALANDGVYTESKTFSKILNAEDAVYLDNSTAKSSIAFSLSTTDALTDLLYNAVQNGTGRAANLSSGMAVAGKTGTTGDNWDRWFCGYTPYYVAACWTGYDIPATINASTNPACVLWKKVMTLVHEDLEVISKFDTTTDYTEEVEEEEETVTICIDSGLLATAACESDIRGNRTTQVKESEAPTGTCTAHTTVNVCSETYCLPNSTCETTTVGVLTSGTGGTITHNGHLTSYILGDIPTCTENHGGAVVSEEPVETSPSPSPSAGASQDPSPSASVTGSTPEATNFCTAVTPPDARARRLKRRKRLRIHCE